MTAVNDTRADVDDTLARLRSGAELTARERLGLAELLMGIRCADRTARRSEHDNPDARSGLWLRVHEVFADEFTSNTTADDPEGWAQVETTGGVL